MAARISLIREKVFWGQMAMRLELVEAPSIKTMATDGVRLFYNPVFVESLKFDELVGVVAHEAGHPMHSHHLRENGRSHNKWNIACDAVLNIALKEERFKLPDGAVDLPHYADMSAEEVYDRLTDKEVEKYQSGDGWNIGEVLDGTDGMSEQQIAAAEGQIKAAIANAAAMARKAGQMSAGLERLIDGLLKPKADWRTILWQWLTAKAENDYSWAQPHTRMLQQYGVVYPVLYGYKLGNIGIFHDASGSTSSAQEQFVSEISDILMQYECKITVLTHDTTTLAIEEYSSDDLPIKFKVVGFGGTDARHTFELASEHDFDVIIWLTDLEVDCSKLRVPECPVLIACCGRHYINAGPKWATVIDIT